MDPLPHVPPSKGINDTLCFIRNVFQEKLESEVFSADIANNLKTYAAIESLGFKENATKVFKIYRSLEDESECAKNTEYDIIKQHVDYIFAKNKIEKNQFLKEMMKLKSHDIFGDIYLPDKLRYGIIQKCDLYPDLARQFLDFRFNTTLHQCKMCFPKEENIGNISGFRKKTRKLTINAKACTEKPSTLQLEPPEIVFKNFELNTIYKQTLKIKNISTQIQQMSILSYPNLSVFTLIFEVGQKIAPGMYTTAIIKFAPETFTNQKDHVSFITRKGEILTLLIRCHRDPPKLAGFVHKSIDYLHLSTQHSPDCKGFSVKRQRALNSTIDCGTCLATEFVLVSLILVNTGNKAKFFWLSEEHFCYQDITNISSSLEMTQESFWIYPTYFEILEGRCCEINILFQPLHCGLQTQTLYLMCDNNTYQQVELLGDGICFNRNMITVDIPYHTKEIEKKEGHSIFLGFVRYNEKASFPLSITNRSSIFFKYVLQLEKKDEVWDMSEWIKVINVTPQLLAPYSTTDVIYEMQCQNDVPKGCYKAKLRLFIKDIPIASIEDGDPFLVSTNGKSLKDITDNLSAVDILLMEVEVACYVDPLIEVDLPPPLECEGCGHVNCSCEVCNENIPLAEIEFDQPFLEFGILPVGVDLKKNFHITNLGKTHLKWNIVELKYSIDCQPYLQVVNETNLSSYSGSLPPYKKHRLSYTIERKTPARYVSILVLFVEKEELDFVAQSICVVSYEITELNIVIKTGQSEEPILCPMQMLYTEVPINITFMIQNTSLIPGCFYFLTPIGSDADKIEVKCNPQSGELSPGAKKKICITLTCQEVGILENIFLPCFIGKSQEPIQLRLLCVVDCVHVFFYLPTKNNNFERILWPPKVIYEHDLGWSDYCICEELSNAEENTINCIKSEHTEQLLKQSNETLNAINSGSETATDSNRDECSTQDILKTLVNADPQIFIQECVMEVKRVIAKEPKKVTIYFENVTPKPAKYSIQSTNYPAKENNIKACFGPKYEKTEDLWEAMIENYGILVHPNAESTYMKANELVSIDIWIYANTWGIYAEEIIVDIENIASFSFSLIIEVIGCPLQLPISIGAITKYPTVRFGSAIFESEPITRDVVIRNTSSIDVVVSWHVFYSHEDNDDHQSPFNFICDVVEQTEEQFEFDFTERFFGEEGFDCIDVLPRKLEVNHGSQLSVPVVLKPQFVKCVGEKYKLKCFILGRIFPKENDRLKSNYFYRKYDSLIIQLTATLEKSRLDIEIENDILQIYANDVAIKRQTDYYIKLFVRNPTLSVIKFALDGGEPFCLTKIDREFVLEPGKCKEIYLPCVLPYEKILKWAPYVYHLTEIKELPSNQTSDTVVRKFEDVKCISSDEKIVDNENKILKLHKKLFLFYQGEYQKVFPIDIYIYYPNIAVKPAHVKFGFILLGCTKKTTITVYNLTGCKILFDVYKSISTQEIVINPPYGEIKKSTGLNHNFKNITIYFTPTECKTYHESIRIVTNIPQYYIDIPIKANGSFNEKFN